MSTPTSIDYGRLIQYTSQKLHLQKLNKTQVNKILFFVYGRYLAVTGQKLFTDDTPKAWPYGPVFPRVNKRTDPSEVIKFSKEEVAMFKANETAVEIIVAAVGKMHNMSAVYLTKWSHEEGSPWFRTLYEGMEKGKQRAWNTEIPDEYIKEYFSLSGENGKK